MGQLIFLIETACDVRHRMQSCLEEAGYLVRAFSTIEVLQEAEIARPALILASLILPGGSSMELSRRLRENHLLYRTPLIFLLDPSTHGQRTLASESRSDDSLLKSCSPAELVGCVRNVLQSHPARPTLASAPADLAIDVPAMRLSVRGQEVEVTSLEFRLIEYLSKHQGQVFTRDLLLDAVWGDMQFVTPRSVDACIRRIRKKIESNPDSPTYLKTVRGTGYRLDATTVWQLPGKDTCGCKACKSAVASQADPARRRA